MTIVKMTIADESLAGRFIKKIERVNIKIRIAKFKYVKYDFMFQVHILLALIKDQQYIWLIIKNTKHMHLPSGAVCRLLIKTIQATVIISTNTTAVQAIGIIIFNCWSSSLSLSMRDVIGGTVAEIEMNFGFITNVFTIL